MYNENFSAELEGSYTLENKQQWKCFAVFDGIGGTEYGELASKYAAEAAKEISLELKDEMEYFQVDKVIQKLFLEANNKIIIARKEKAVCGTTGTVLVTDGIMAKIFHVGDSRAYLYRNGKLFRLTKDQTLAQLKVDSGFYQSIKDAGEREQHQLTEYIGRDESMQYFRPAEGAWFDFRIEDQILLCSDGLYDQCKPSEIKTALSASEDAKTKIGHMIDIVKKNGARDNITCMLVEKKEDD